MAEPLVFLALAALVGLLLGEGALVVRPMSRREARLRWPIQQCCSCGREASLRDLIPLYGRGRCVSCRAPAQASWWILPIGTSLLFSLAYLRYGSLLEGFLAGIFLALLLVLAVTDVEQHLLPDRITLPSMLLALATSWLVPGHSELGSLVGGVLAVIIAAVFVIGSLPFGKQAFGMGDVKLIVLLGLLLGPGALVVAVFLATTSASVASAVLLAARVRRTGDYLPFGAFLAFGGGVSCLWGGDLWRWYADRL